MATRPTPPPSPRGDGFYSTPELAVILIAQYGPEGAYIEGLRFAEHSCTCENSVELVTLLRLARDAARLAAKGDRR
jgi:hypothetical protein